MSSENNILKLKNGKKICYAEYGNPKGKPIFYFHGWPSSRLSAEFTDLIAKKEKIRIIVPDRPGYGLSDYQENRTLLDWPDTVIEIADKIGVGKFAVIGQSGGGPYSAVCAYKIPQRLSKAGIVVGLSPTNIDGVLEGLGFFNTLAWKYYYIFPFLMDWASTFLLLQAKKLFLYKTTSSFRSQSDQKILSSEVRNKEFMESRKEAFRQGKRGCLHDLRIYSSSWGFDLKKIKIPVFLWYGEEDKNVSVNMGKYYKSHIPKSNLTIYPNEGHLILYTHTKEILKKMVE